MSNSFDVLQDGIHLTQVMINLIKAWNIQPQVASSISEAAEKAVEILLSVPGMTPANARDFQGARPIFTLKDGTVVKTYKNPVGVDHIFLGNSSGEMFFGGFVGWVHAQGLEEAIKKIRR